MIQHWDMDFMMNSSMICQRPQKQWLVAIDFGSASLHRWNLEK